MFIRRVRLLRVFTSAEEAAAVLGLSLPFDATQLNVVRLRKIQQFHPDKAQGADEKEYATEKIKDIADAHKYLKEWLNSSGGIDAAFADRWQRTRKQPESGVDEPNLAGDHFQTAGSYQPTAATRKPYTYTPPQQETATGYWIILTVICGVLTVVSCIFAKKWQEGPEGHYSTYSSENTTAFGNNPSYSWTRSQKYKYSLREYSKSWLSRTDREKAELEEWYDSYMKEARELEKFLRAWRLCERKGQFSLTDRSIFHEDEKHAPLLAEKQQRMIDAHVKYGFGLPEYISPPSHLEISLSKPEILKEPMRVPYKEKAKKVKSTKGEQQPERSYPPTAWAQPKEAEPYSLPEGSMTVADWLERKTKILALRVSQLKDQQEKEVAA
eukprot:TRINITY_DN67315_c8_g1_i1.p1 TRINITY_DN67315_c8_g1~~TRINITY_DN67315_c8_g1_i1.p1  ORF type:complete len:383 (+),score=25.91 TRINITY_DN67315_c8_g1_i1:81-1229(+)